MANGTVEPEVPKAGRLPENLRVLDTSPHIALGCTPPALVEMYMLLKLVQEYVVAEIVALVLLAEEQSQLACLVTEEGAALNLPPSPGFPSLRSHAANSVQRDMQPAVALKALCYLCSCVTGMHVAPHRCPLRGVEERGATGAGGISEVRALHSSTTEPRPNCLP